MFNFRLFFLGFALLSFFGSIEVEGCACSEIARSKMENRCDMLKGLTLTVTVYETSPGLKHLLYSTTQFHFNEDGSTEVEPLAGLANDNLGKRKGQVLFSYQDAYATVYIHKDDAFEGYFTNVLYSLSETTGELVATKGDQYVKCYAKIERAKK